MTSLMTDPRKDMIVRMVGNRRGDHDPAAAGMVFKLR